MARTSAQFHILIVDDDPTGRTTLASYLTREGFRVSEAATGGEMREVFDKEQVDLLILDVNLPGEDGFAVLKRVRAHSALGVIMVTVRADEIDRITGLEMGADDYVTKPYNPWELVARVRGVLRRTTAMAKMTANPTNRTFCGWTLDIGLRRLLSPCGKTVRLTRGEYDLFEVLVNNSRHVLSRDTILDLLKGQEWVSNDRSIDVLISRLRRKIEADPRSPEIIITVHGVGYLFAGDVADAV